MAEKFYLKNKSLMEEIHKSKITYSSYIDKKYTTYHHIAATKEMITQELVDSIVSDLRTPKGKAIPLILAPEDVVIRVMTHEHIGIDPLRKRRPKNMIESYAWTNFPPYKHYILKDGILKEVGRSHWKGDFETGYFTVESGQMTNTLARMFMLLIERYSSRYNFRGYCVDSETEALTKRGWVNGFDLTVEDEIYSYDKSDSNLKWSKISSIYKDENFEGRMFKLTGEGIDALVTSFHKFLTTEGAKLVDHLTIDDQLIVMGNGIIENSEVSWKTVNVKDIDFHGALKTIRNIPTEDYKGLVWCPSTELGNFISKRNQVVSLSMNSYRDEMCSNALVHLMKAGLAFDESKSNNPFAFYTRVLLNCFRSVLKAEKIQQSIRDELLMSAGVAPSMSKQMEGDNSNYSTDVYTKAVRKKNKDTD